MCYSMSMYFVSLGRSACSAYQNWSAKHPKSPGTSKNTKRADPSNRRASTLSFSSSTVSHRNPVYSPTSGTPSRKRSIEFGQKSLELNEIFFSFLERKPIGPVGILAIVTPLVKGAISPESECISCKACDVAWRLWVNPL